MSELTEKSVQKTDTAYRTLSKDTGDYVIDLGDLFNAIETDNHVRRRVAQTFTSPPPITILIEGSAFVQNIDFIDKKIAARNNPKDRVILIDISPTAISSHQNRVNGLPAKEKYSITWGDMNDIRLEDGTVDMVINDCAINFNTFDEQNIKTVAEIKRVMRPRSAICLFSTVVPKKFDSIYYGLDQELVPKDQVDKPVDFYPLTFAEPSTAISRKCWPLPYYRSLLNKAGFSSRKFDEQRGKTYFPAASQISYRRFLLTT